MTSMHSSRACGRVASQLEKRVPVHVLDSIAVHHATSRNLHPTAR